MILNLYKFMFSNSVTDLGLTIVIWYIENTYTLFLTSLGLNMNTGMNITPAKAQKVETTVKQL